MRYNLCDPLPNRKQIPAVANSKGESTMTIETKDDFIKNYQLFIKGDITKETFKKVKKKFSKLGFDTKYISYEQRRAFPQDYSYIAWCRACKTHLEQDFSGNNKKVICVEQFLQEKTQ